MGILFSKLSNSLNVNKVKNSSMSEEERTEIEKNLIFGNLMEDAENILAVDQAESDEIPDPDELASVDAIPKTPLSDLNTDIVNPQE